MGYSAHGVFALEEVGHAATDVDQHFEKAHGARDWSVCLRTALQTDLPMLSLALTSSSFHAFSDS